MALLRSRHGYVLGTNTNRVACQVGGAAEHILDLLVSRGKHQGRVAAQFRSRTSTQMSAAFRLGLRREACACGATSPTDR